MASREEISLSQHVFGVQSGDDFVSRLPRRSGVNLDYHILPVSQLACPLEAYFQAGRTCQLSSIRCQILLISSNKLVAALQRRNPHRGGEFAHLAIGSDADNGSFIKSKVS